MRTAALFRTTAILIVTALATFASARYECAAQTEAVTDRERLALSAAIEKARRSPFHAGARGQTNALRSIETGIGGAGWYHPQESGLQEEASLPGPPFGLTLVLAQVSHLAAAYLLLGCGYGYASSGCVLGPALTVPAVVALPAGLSGVPFETAFIASTAGLVGGIGAFMMTMAVTEKVDDANPLFSGFVSGLVHAGISTALFRRLR